MEFIEELAACMFAWQVAKVASNASDLLATNLAMRKEQLTQEQMRSQMMMMQMKIAELEAQKRIETSVPEHSGFLTLADVGPIHREAYPNMTDADWQLHLNELNAT